MTDESSPTTAVTATTPAAPAAPTAPTAPTTPTTPTTPATPATPATKIKRFFRNEWVWLGIMFAISTIAALVLVATIPIVNKLPKGTSATEYVVNATVARFGLPVVFFLLLASLATVVGHNKGDGRPWLDFAAKVLTFGAATFSFWAVLLGLRAGGVF
ncbi:hypothetical protein VH571_11955 [Frondihabitans sp. 4ASC-45]|uniref:hypothetical protein n=1 Tax=Frondihabitans sp. 4ASC-45 TaxID=3111636 RepID=UPI003C1E3DDF